MESVNLYLYFLASRYKKFIRMRVILFFKSNYNLKKCPIVWRNSFFFDKKSSNAV